MTRVRDIKLTVLRVDLDKRHGLGEPGQVVIDDDGFCLPVTPEVAWELKGELLRVGTLFRATLLFDEDQYKAVDVLSTSGPSLLSRLRRFFWRILGHAPT